MPDARQAKSYTERREWEESIATLLHDCGYPRITLIHALRVEFGACSTNREDQELDTSREAAYATDSAISFQLAHADHRTLVLCHQILPGGPMLYAGTAERLRARLGSPALAGAVLGVHVGNQEQVWSLLGLQERGGKILIRVYRPIIAGDESAQATPEPGQDPYPLYSSERLRAVLGIPFRS